MSEQTPEKLPHKDGPPWDSKRVFATFGEADTFRKNVLTDNTKQAKVKRFVNATGIETFAVKVRDNSEFLPKEEKPKKNKKS